ncbi:hypothetical protein GQ602_002149 [Ophiocordyceps camponoti-floridani]|uniref:Uncharacterized protein n=1 Tax=Ophiocordyceps camponoti-floridani TaxID=2030778 RepID=A0A8H4VF10_9HYPO|nr:hypothetical protein GQ602_002149 [Ophiocordyceps camponoti-floridani]
MDVSCGIEGSELDVWVCGSISFIWIVFIWIVFSPGFISFIWSIVWFSSISFIWIVFIRIVFIRIVFIRIVFIRIVFIRIVFIWIVFSPGFISFIWSIVRFSSISFIWSIVWFSSISFIRIVFKPGFIILIRIIFRPGSFTLGFPRSVSFIQRPQLDFPLCTFINRTFHSFQPEPHRSQRKLKTSYKCRPNRLNQSLNRSVFLRARLIRSRLGPGPIRNVQPRLVRNDRPGSSRPPGLIDFVLDFALLKLEPHGILDRQPRPHRHVAKHHGKRRPTRAPDPSGSPPATTPTTGSPSSVPVGNSTVSVSVSVSVSGGMPPDPRPRRQLHRRQQVRSRIGAQLLSPPDAYGRTPRPASQRRVDFASDGVQPLFVTLRDAAKGTHYLDVSDKGHVAIVDSLGNAMILDARGIHFSTNSCRFDVSFTIGGLYDQLAKLSGQVCAKGAPNLLKEADDDVDDDDADAPFGQLLFLRDQCGRPIGRHLREYPLLRLGASECRDVDVDDALGRWRFDCAFPGASSNATRCRRAVRRSVANFLFVAPFAGSCPDLSTVVSTLEATSQDFLNAASLREDLYSRGLDDQQRADADLAVIYYEQLWEILKQALSRARAKPPAVDAAVKVYLDAYASANRRFDADVCRDLHAPDPPLELTLRAGAAPLPVVARFGSAPPPDAPPPPRNLTVLDSTSRACCSRGSDSSFGGASPCSYPSEAILGDSGCVCGHTADGASIAFEYTGCDNFVARCSSDADCVASGHSRHVCLTGSCCGGGVCVDPFECSRNDTGLVPGPGFLKHIG